MTTSELILRKIALRLAIMVAFVLLGHLPDRRVQLPTAPAHATEISATCPPSPDLSIRLDVARPYTD